VICPANAGKAYVIFETMRARKITSSAEPDRFDSGISIATEGTKADCIEKLGHQCAALGT